MTRLETELTSLEKEERKPKPMLINGYAPSTATSSSPCLGSRPSSSGHHKSNRKSRDSRSRSQDWPDVPDVGKIEENNPELLAQKILETGRQIEAGKLTPSPSAPTSSGLPRMNGHYPELPSGYPPRQNYSVKPPPPSPKSQPPRVANFEDRLKSIITSVLNEDQANRQPVPIRQPHVPTPPLPMPMSMNSRAVPVMISQAQSTPSIPHKSVAALAQPDYTQVSPAKLALRRHLSQEKLAAASAQQLQHLASNEKGYVATRSIGDLVSGEIERTLEISNQSIINAAVDMSSILRSSPLNRNTVYSPISRPSSAEGGLPANPPTSTPALEGLGYPAGGLATLAHVAYAQAPRATVLLTSPHHPPPSSSSSTSTSVTSSSLSNSTSCRYAPVQLPRADIKPYHESFFADAPVEGLAARVVHQEPPPVIKEEADTTPCLLEVKTEISEESARAAQLKRASPVIHGPLRPAKKLCTELSPSDSLVTIDPTTMREEGRIHA